MAEINQATGARTRIVYCKESVWDTAPTTGYREINFVAGESLDADVAVYASNIIRSDRMPNKSVRGSKRPGGSIPFELCADDLGFLFYQALGYQSVSGAGPTYTHTLKGATSLPTGFTLEKGFLDLTTPQYALFTGCKVSGFSLNFTNDAMVTGSFDIMARNLVVSATPKQAALITAAPTVEPFTSLEAVVSKDGSPIAVVNSLSMSLTNGFKDNQWALGSALRAGLKPGTRRVSGSATFLFDDMAYYNLAANGTIADLKVVCTDGNSRSVEIRLPEMQFLPQNSLPKISDDGPLMLTTNFEAFKDVALDTDIQMTIINTMPSLNI